MSQYRSAAAWDEAYARAIKDEKQWKRFCKLIASSKSSSSPQLSSAIDVASVVQQLQKASEEKDAKPVNRFLNQGIDALLSIKDVGSAVAGLNPYAAAGWAVVAFVADAAAKHKQEKEFCWQRISILSSMVDRYQTFECVIFEEDALPSSNEKLHDQLVDLFTQILQFQIACVIAVESRTQRMKSIFGGGKVQQIAEDVNEQDQRLQRLQTLVAQQTARKLDRIRFEDLMSTVQSLKDYTSSQNELIDLKLEALKIKLDVDERNKILNWVSDIQYERIHDKETKSPVQATADWLLDDEAYSRWTEATPYALMWLFGHMGSGKSCVTHAVIEDLKRKCMGVDDERLVFFYCDKTDERGRAEMSSTDGILRCMLKQLVYRDQPGSVDDRIFKAYIDQKEKRLLKAQECEQLITQLANDFNLTIVIDGLDEAPSEVQRGLMESLRSIVAQKTRTVRLFISSRDVPSIRAAISVLGGPSKTTINIATRNDQSIKTMIDAKVDSVVSSLNRHLYIDEEDDRSQIQEVKRLLKRRADGMFLWANTALEFLHKSETFDEMSDRLEMLSQERLEKVDALYAAVFEESIRQAREAGNERLLWLLILFVLYGEDIPPSNWNIDGFETWHEGVNYGTYGNESFSEECVSAGPQLWVREACCLIRHGQLKKGKYTTRTLSSYCPGLICVAEGSTYYAGSLYVPHASVREFFTSTYREFEPRHGHACLAGFCMNLFVNPSYRKQCETYINTFSKKDFKRSNGIFVYAASFWYHHLRKYDDNKDPTVRLEDGLDADNLATKSDFNFQDVFHQFLLSDNAPRSFETWTRLVSQRIKREHDYSYPRSFDKSSLVASTKASTIFARTIFRLPTDYASFHQAGLLDVETIYPKQRTFELAIRLRVIPLMEKLLAENCTIKDPCTEEGYTLSFFHVLVDQASDGTTIYPEYSLTNVFRLLRETGFDIMEAQAPVVSAPVYMLTRKMPLDDLLPLFDAFLNAGLSPTHVERYLSSYIRQDSGAHRWHTKFGDNFSLTGLIAQYQVNYHPQIETLTNPLLLSRATARSEIDKLLAQAAQSGNFLLVDSLLDAGANPFWEDWGEDEGSLCALERALLACCETLGIAHGWYDLNIIGTIEDRSAVITRYSKTITLLVAAVLSHDKELEQRKWFMSHPCFVNAMVACCKVEVVKKWIEQVTPMRDLLVHQAYKHLQSPESDGSGRISPVCDGGWVCRRKWCIHRAQHEGQVYPYSAGSIVVDSYCLNKDDWPYSGRWHKFAVDFARDEIKEIDLVLSPRPRAASATASEANHSGTEENSTVDRSRSTGVSNKSNQSDNEDDRTSVSENEDDANSDDESDRSTHSDLSDADGNGADGIIDLRKALQRKTLRQYRRQMKETLEYLEAAARDDPTISFDEKLGCWVANDLQ